MKRFWENTLLSARHLTEHTAGGKPGVAFVRRILRIPNRGWNTTEGEAPRLASDGTARQITRYPRMDRRTHFADFMRDERINVYHCLIQRVGSNEILAWTQHRSLEAAWTQHRSLEAAMKSAEANLTALVGSIAAGM
jgi:hypothetical protein